MIEIYFTQDLTIKRKTRTKDNGVVKETLATVATTRGAIEKSVSAYNYQNDKETFNYTDIVFTYYDAPCQEDDVVEIGGLEYDVVSVVNPMMRNHHLEIRCIRRE